VVTARGRKRHRGAEDGPGGGQARPDTIARSGTGWCWTAAGVDEYKHRLGTWCLAAEDPEESARRPAQGALTSARDRSVGVLLTDTMGRLAGRADGQRDRCRRGDPERDYRGEPTVRATSWRSPRGVAAEIASARPRPVKGKGPAVNGSRLVRGLGQAWSPIGRPGRAGHLRAADEDMSGSARPTCRCPPRPSGPSPPNQVEAATRPPRDRTADDPPTPPAPNSEPWRFRRGGDGRGPDGAARRDARGRTADHGR